MKLSIQDCTNEDKEYLAEKLVDYNLSKVQAEQSELFIDLSHKIEKDGTEEFLTCLEAWRLLEVKKVAVRIAEVEKTIKNRAKLSE